MKLLPLKFWLVNGCISLGLLTFPDPNLAQQIVPDNTLPRNSKTTPAGDTIRIDGGTQSGDNLFHSFEQFSVPTNQTALFNNALDIQNIFSRVTGRSISNIDGTIQARGAANLFLINPNGIIFGENASLNIGGSFLASTASSLIFPNGEEFSVTNPQAPPLLNVDVPVPIGLRFEGMPGKITNQSIALGSEESTVGLQVQPEKTLALVGGVIRLEGGVLTAEGGRIELGSVAGNNVVNLSSTNRDFALDYEGVQNFQDINLSQGAFVDTRGDRGGDIQVQGRRVTLTEGSQIVSVSLAEGQAGDLIVKASELVKLEGVVEFEGEEFPSALLAEVEGEATGKGTALSIETERLIVKDGAQISTTTFGAGQGADLRIRDLESVELIGISAGGLQSGLFTQAEAEGRGGNLMIETERLVIRDGAVAEASTLGPGRAGDVNVIASESVELIGTGGEAELLSGIFAQVDKAKGATGDAGDLFIETGRLTVLNGAQISTVARNGAQGGNLTVNAKDSILLSGTAPDATLIGGQSGILVSSEPAGEGLFGGVVTPGGNSGNLLINTPRLTVENGAKISADTFGSGEGGNATLKVDQLFVRDGGLVRAGSLVEKGAPSRERGPGGTLTIKDSELVEVSGTGTVGDREIPVNSQLFTAAEGTGDAGNLIITTEQLTVRDGGEVTASTSGAGEGGNITLNVRESINLEGTNSGIFANTAKGSSGDGGSIDIDPETVIIRDGASIAVDSEGTGQGGNIALEAGTLILDRGAITAETDSTQGGNVTLQVQDILFLEDGSTISATAGTAQSGGDGGNVAIEADFIIADPNDNSDITANAFTGKGGQVTISAEGILGIEERDRPTTLSDITATSEFGVAGVVEIETPEVDPNRALAALPDTPDEVELAQGCQADEEQGTVAFFNVGRGGLPPRPDEPLRSETIITPWVGLTSEAENLTQILEGTIVTTKSISLLPAC